MPKRRARLFVYWLLIVGLGFGFAFTDFSWTAIFVSVCVVALLLAALESFIGVREVTRERSSSPRTERPEA